MASADQLNTMGKQSVATLQMGFPRAPKSRCRPATGDSQLEMAIPTRFEMSRQFILTWISCLRWTRFQSVTRMDSWNLAFSANYRARGDWPSNGCTHDNGNDRSERRYIGPVTRRQHQSSDFLERILVHSTRLTTYRFETSAAFSALRQLPAHLSKDTIGQVLRWAEAQATASSETDTSLSRKLRDLRVAVTRSIALEDR